MKPDDHKRYRTISFYAFGVIAASILFYYLLNHFKDVLGGLFFLLKILSPVIYGFGIAYLLNPLLKLTERYLFGFIEKKKPRPKLRRIAAVVVTYLIFIGMLVLFISLVIPELIRSITDLINNVPRYYDALAGFLKELVYRLDLSEAQVNQLIKLSEEAFNSAAKAMQNLLPVLYGLTLSVTAVLKNFVLGLMISIYILVSKEKFTTQLKKLLSATASETWNGRLLRLFQITNDIFGRFVSGKALDSLIITVICYVVMLLLGWPYASLISITIGISNMIPYFGLFFGSIPCVLILLIISPWKALFFALFILLLGLLDANFLSPKIIGKSIGLNAFWVMFAMVLGGGLFGFVGMFISVPTFAVLYSIVRSLMHRRLQRKSQASWNSIK